MSAFNYNLPQPKVDALGGFKQGLQLGEHMQDRQYLQEQRVQKDLAQQQQMEAKRKQQDYNTRMQEDLYNFTQIQSPTTKDFIDLSMKYPKLKDTIKQSYDMQSETKKQDSLNFASNIYALSEAGDNEQIATLFQNRIDNSNKVNNKKDADLYSAYLKSFEMNPSSAKQTAGLMLNAVLGDKEFSKMFGEMEESKREDIKIPLEQYTKQQDIQIKKDTLAVRTMEAKLRQEDNSLKRDELKLKIEEKRAKIDENKNKREIAGREKEAEAEGAIESYNRAIGTIDEILAHKGLDAGTGLTSFTSALPATEARGFKNLVDRLTSQAFMSEISKMKGQGSLSDAEGKKVATAVANLDTAQSTTDFKKNLRTAYKIFQKGLNTTEKKYGASIKSEQATESPSQPSKGYLQYAN